MFLHRGKAGLGREKGDKMLCDINNKKRRNYEYEYE